MLRHKQTCSLSSSPYEFKLPLPININFDVEYWQTMTTEKEKVKLVELIKQQQEETEKEIRLDSFFNQVLLIEFNHSWTTNHTNLVNQLLSYVQLLSKEHLLGVRLENWFTRCPLFAIVIQREFERISGKFRQTETEWNERLIAVDNRYQEVSNLCSFFNRFILVSCLCRNKKLSEFSEVDLLSVEIADIYFRLLEKLGKKPNTLARQREFLKKAVMVCSF